MFYFKGKFYNLKFLKNDIAQIQLTIAKECFHSKKNEEFFSFPDKSSKK